MLGGEMNTKFTPGPWKAVPWHIAEGPSEVRAKEGWLICQTSSDANAHLIAAAPMLYEALENILSDYEAACTLAFEGDVTQREATQIALAHSALKAARGES